MTKVSKKVLSLKDIDRPAGLIFSYKNELN